MSTTKTKERNPNDILLIKEIKTNNYYVRMHPFTFPHHLSAFKTKKHRKDWHQDYLDMEKSVVSGYLHFQILVVYIL